MKLLTSFGLAAVLFMATGSAWATPYCYQVCTSSTSCGQACLLYDSGWVQRDCWTFGCCSPVWQHTSTEQTGWQCEMYDGNPNVWYGYVISDKTYTNLVPLCGPRTKVECAEWYHRVGSTYAQCCAAHGGCSGPWSC